MSQLKIIIVLIITIICAVINSANTAKILGIFHVSTPSHYILGSSLLKGLAEKGHNVTMIAPFSEKNPPKNYNQIVLSDVRKAMQNLIKEIKMFEEIETKNIISMSLMFLEKFALFEEIVLNNSDIQQLLNSNEQFDVVIVEQFLNEAIKAFAHHFNAPLIIFSTLGANTMFNSLVGNPLPPSYVPNVFLSYSSHMTFIQRLTNSLCSNIINLLAHYFLYPFDNKLMHKYFPHPPNDIADVMYNVSLVLLNSHPSINQPVPYVPNMIDIGGFHVKPPKKLPKDLQEFLDNAPDGVIYFSMGSNLKSVEMSENVRTIFLQVFSKLKQKILWKWEDDELPGQPENVKLGKWLPQQDILAHPNIKVFITHGGLLSTIETIYHGVPILAIPIAGDQKLNAANAVNSGFGLSIGYREINEEKFTKLLQELLNNSKYRDNAKKRSQLLHDQPLKPLDNAIYWTEYVIRHKGAPHLRVAGLDLTWYQYLLLDVIVLAVLIVSLVLFVIYKIFKKLFCSKSRKLKIKIN